MHIESFRSFCLSFKGVTESFPFDHKTIVFKVGNKMFALADIEEFESFNVKCGPEKAIDLRERYQAVNPGSGSALRDSRWKAAQDYFESFNADGGLMTSPRPQMRPLG